MVKDTYQKALSLSEKDYRLHNEYGLFLLSKLDFRASTEQFRIAQKLAKSSTEIRFNLALSYLERNRFKDARKHLSWIIRKKKHFSQHKLTKALYSFSKKEFESSTKQLKTIKLTSPNKLIVEYYLARILSLTKQESSAIVKYKLILNDRQWQYLADLRRSRDLTTQNNYPESLLITNKLLAETLNIETLLYQKSNLLMLSGENQKALAAITLAFQASSTSPKMTLRYASLLHLNGKTEKAIPTLQELLVKNPQFMRGRELLAEIYLDTKQIDLAIEQYQIAISNESTNTKIKFKLATILVENKHYSQANNLLNDLLLQQSKNIQARILLAKSKLLNLEIPQSLIEINLALKLEPENLAANKLKTTILESL
jgi:Tfp pilus assembly protein PilF